MHGNVLYVLNARGGGSVQGFWIIGQRLIRIPAWHRALGLDPTATPEFTHTPGQIAFDPSGSRLPVTTKAATSSVDVFRVGRLGDLTDRPDDRRAPRRRPLRNHLRPLRARRHRRGRHQQRGCLRPGGE